MSIQHISHIPIYVADQDEALSWFREKLGFRVCDDNSQYMPGFRWLTISPQQSHITQFVLMPVISKEDQQRVGRNGMCVLMTNDCVGDCQEFAERGVSIIDAPSQVPWGVSAIFEDLYGNPYNLLQRD